MSKLCPRRSSRANAKWVWYWHGIPNLLPPPHHHHPLNSASLHRKPLPTRPRRVQSRDTSYFKKIPKPGHRPVPGPRSPFVVILRPPRTGFFWRRSITISAVIHQYVSFGEVDRVCRVPLGEHIHLCTCVREGGDGEDCVLRFWGGPTIVFRQCTPAQVRCSSCCLL